MSFTIHPFCENGDNVPENCVHAGPVSLGLLRKDYKADTAQLWRAGINPSTNLLVASTTFSRGIVGGAATSTPRYWWISGPLFDQPTLEMKVKEVVGRLPERAPQNYVPFSSYDDAYDWAKTNGYALINCNYPAYRLGDFNTDTQSLINIESGFLPSFDGSQQKLRNLANPTNSTGFGGSPNAVPHDTVVIQTSGLLGSPHAQIGNESGVQLIGGSHISQIVNPIQGGITNGIVFEAIMQVPDSTNSFTLLQARAGNNSSLFTLGWDSAGLGWHIKFNGVTAYQESPATTGFTSGKYYFNIAIPTAQAGGLPLTLNLNGSSISLAEQVGGLGWSTLDVRFSFGSDYDGSIGNRQVQRFYSAKVHSIEASFNTAIADPFYGTNWPIVQTLYGL